MGWHAVTIKRGNEGGIKDRKKIEQDAVNAVNLCFRGVNRVSADILTNDKTPCVDGSISLYSSEAMSNITLVGSIDVQVKGTEAKRRADEPKRSVSIVDLEYYQTHGGALYFVVFENNERDEVFYRLLLPFDIKRILRDHSGQKSVMLRFKAFPDDRDEITRLITKAIREKAAQQQSAALAYCSVDDYEAGGFNFPECVLTVDVTPNESLASLGPYKSGVYIYGKDERGLRFPVDKIEDLTAVAIGGKCVVSAGEISFETLFFKGEDEVSGIFYKFDDFRIEASSNTLRLNEKGPLSIRLRDLKLLRELRNGASLLVDGRQFLHGFAPDERTGSKSLDSKIEALDCIDAVMKCLNVKVDLDVEALTDQNLRDLHIAYRALIGGELLHRSNKSAGMCLIKLPGFSLKFLLYDKGNDDFLLMDALNVDSSIVTPVLTDDEGVPVVPVPPLLIQTEQELLELGNIDSETFEETCDSFPVSGDNSYYVNNRMLDLIAAADSKAVCASDLLKCAAILVERLEPFTDPEITVINRLQIKKRVGRLTSDDEMNLASLVATGNSLEAKACAAILRGDEMQANVLIGMLPPERANELRGWPVYHLLERSEAD